MKSRLLSRRPKRPVQPPYCLLVKLEIPADGPKIPTLAFTAKVPSAGQSARDCLLPKSTRQRKKVAIPKSRLPPISGQHLAVARATPFGRLSEAGWMGSQSPPTGSAACVRSLGQAIMPTNFLDRNSFHRTHSGWRRGERGSFQALLGV